MIRFIPLFGLAIAALVPAAASAQTSTSQSRCYRDATGIDQCRYEYRGTSMNITTTCASHTGASRCETETSKPEYSPTRIQDGHGPR